MNIIGITKHESVRFIVCQDRLGSVRRRKVDSAELICPISNSSSNSFVYVRLSYFVVIVDVLTAEMYISYFHTDLHISIDTRNVRIQTRAVLNGSKTVLFMRIAYRAVLTE